MPKFVARIIHKYTGREEYLIRESASERELRDFLSDEGLVVQSLRPADFGGKGPQFEIRTPKGRVAGPFGPDVLRAMVRDELLTPHCSLRKTDDLETHAWHPAWKVKGLFPGHVVDSIRRSHTVTKSDDGDTAKLKALKQQLDEGLIDERDYHFKKGELLGTPYEIDQPWLSRGTGGSGVSDVSVVRRYDEPITEVLPAKRIDHPHVKGRTMYCSECGVELLERAVICPSCGCPTRNHRQSGDGHEITSGRIAAVYALAFLFPIGGFIGAVYLCVKGKIGHGVMVIILGLFAMGFWVGFFDSLASQGY
jgi:hypothetical protein